MVDAVSSQMGLARPEHPLDKPSATGKWFLPLFGITLVAFLVVDTVLATLKRSGLTRRRTAPEP